MVSLFLGVAFLVGCKDKGADTALVDTTDPCLVGQPHAWQPYEGPGAAVDVWVDEVGTPHVYAADDLDLFWASGYIQARSRMFQLDLIRRAAAGTLAEAVGEEGLASDQQARTFGFWRYGCESVPAVQAARPDDYDLLVAWTSGVNAYVDELLAGGAPMPDEYTQLDLLPTAISPEDALAMGKRLQFSFANSLVSDVLFTLLGGMFEQPLVVPVFRPGADQFIMGEVGSRSPSSPPVPAAGPVSPSEARRVIDALAGLQRNHGWGPGSNSWVVSGDHTRSGHPLLANDPHATMGQPSLLQAVHLNSADAGGAFDVAGWSFVGMPGVHLGHNQVLGWTATTNMADVMDLWDVAVEDGQVAVGNDRVTIERSEQTIAVRQDDGSVVDQAWTVEWVPGFGVLLPDEILPVPGSMLAQGRIMFGWTGFAPSTEVFQYLDMDRAANLDDFDAAVDLEEVGMHNWTGATADGWRYRVHGLLPDRGPVGQRGTPYAIMDGADSDTLWNEGEVAVDLLPRLDGSQDLLVTANNDPMGFTADNDPLNDEFYYGTWYANGYRAQRIHDVLTDLIAAGPVGVEDMESLQLDARTLVAAPMISALQSAWDRVDEDDGLAEYRGRDDLGAAVGELSAWDGQMVRDSQTAALYRVWLALSEQALLSDDLSYLFDPVEDAAASVLHKLLALSVAEGVDELLDDDLDHALLASLDGALAWRGDSPPQWGDVHVLQFVPMWGEGGRLAVDGDGTTVDVAECSMFDGTRLADSCDTSHMAVFRQITSFDDDGTPVMFWNQPLGDDGDTTRWVEGEYVEMPFRRADVEGRAVEHFTLSEARPGRGVAISCPLEVPMLTLVLALAACSHNHEAAATAPVAEVVEAAPSAAPPAAPQVAATEAPAEGITPTADMTEEQLKGLYEGCHDRVEGREQDGECEQDEDCQVAGCSGEVCVPAAAAADVMTTCEKRLCFGVLSSCGCNEGRCQWTLGASANEEHRTIPRPQ